MEEEARVQSLQPRARKSFAESRKSDRSMVTGSGKGAVAPPKETTPPAEADGGGGGGGGGGGAKVNGGGSPVKGSPRNLDKLKKLGTRERGGGKAEKKQSGKK